MTTASFSLADTNVHNLLDLWKDTHPLEATYINTVFDFDELHIVADPANGGTVAVSMNADVDIAGKQFGWLLSNTSAEIVLRRPLGSQRISANNIWVAASAATQYFHVTGLL